MGAGARQPAATSPPSTSSPTGCTHPRRRGRALELGVGSRLVVYGGEESQSRSEGELVPAWPIYGPRRRRFGHPRQLHPLGSRKGERRARLRSPARRFSSRRFSREARVGGCRGRRGGSARAAAIFARRGGAGELRLQASATAAGDGDDRGAGAAEQQLAAAHESSEPEASTSRTTTPRGGGGWPPGPEERLARSSSLAQLVRVRPESILSSSAIARPRGGGEVGRGEAALGVGRDRHRHRVPGDRQVGMVAHLCLAQTLDEAHREPTKSPQEKLLRTASSPRPASGRPGSSELGLAEQCHRHLC